MSATAAARAPAATKFPAFGEAPEIFDNLTLAAYDLDDILDLDPEPTWKPPTDKQADFWLSSDDYKLNLAEGAVSSGKTVGSFYAWIDRCENGPRGNFIMIGKTERTLKRNVLDPIRELVGEDLYEPRYGDGEVYICGRKCYLAGAHNVGAVEKIQGLSLVSAYGDEITTWPEEVWEMLISRLRQPGAKLWGTMNPAGPFHWMKTGVIDRAAEVNAIIHHFGIDDNPYLPPDYVEWIKGFYRGLFYKRFILGLWVAAEGLIYDIDIGSRRSPGQHGIYELPDRFARTVVGVDYGITHPFAALAEGWDPAKKRWVAYTEFVHDISDEKKAVRPKTDEELAEDLADFIEDLDPLPDSAEVSPDAASFRLQAKKTFKERGLKVQIRNAFNSVLPGIQNVNRDLGRGRLVFYVPGVPRTLKGCSNYTWDPKATERGEDAPLKKNDDEADALRYCHARATKGRAIVTGKPRGL